MAFSLSGRRIGKVGVVGSGNIGPDIALHFSTALSDSGVAIVVVDVDQGALDKGAQKVAKKLEKGTEKGAFTKEKADAILANIDFTLEYGQVAGSDLVVEAATENLEIKRRIFKRLEDLCPSDAVLASNSSHMEPERIFSEAEDKHRCLVIHYFFPAERNPLVEIVPSSHTKPELVDFLMRFYERIGKVPISVRSRYGFAVDPIFEGLFLAATLLVEGGAANIKQVDAIAQKSLGQGVGPFTAMNLTGGNPITQHGLNEMKTAIMPWFSSPKLLDDQIASAKPWETAQRNEKVEYSQETFREASNQLQGAFFGLASEVVDSGITSVGDLEMAVETGLVMKGPFAMMNEVGVGNALQMVKAYAEKRPGFKVPQVLVDKASSGEPWKIPYVFRKDEGEVAVVTIRRPSVLNALNSAVIENLRETFTEIREDDSIKGGVLTGFGTRAFVSGADIKELAALKTAAEGEAFSLRGKEVFDLIENLGKPVICAMNGLAFGGGCELAMACTARIAKRGVKVLAGQPEPKLGIIPGYGGTQRLPRLVDFDSAWEILRTGNPISSEKAKKIGFVWEEVEGDLMEEAISLAKRAISGEVTFPQIGRDPIKVPDTLPELDIGHLSRKTDELLRKAILGGAKMALDEGLRHESRTFGECLLTKDMKIGMENFIKFGPKKPAEFVHA